MSDKESTGELVEMVGVHVVNTAHDGYRRAGFVLQKGENILSTVPTSVLKALEADPRLAVMVIASDIDSVTSGRLGDQVIPTTITFDDPPPVPVIETTERTEVSHAEGGITIHVERRPEEAQRLVDEIEQLSNALEPATKITAPIEAPTPALDTEAAQPATPKKGKGKK